MSSKFYFHLVPFLDKTDKWLYKFNFKFILLSISLTNLSGKIVICNLMLFWEKDYKKG